MRLALLAAAATGVQVGSALVASEAVVAEVGAGRLGFLRYGLALIFLLPFALRSIGPSVGKHDLLPIALIGIGQFGVLIALLNVAVLYSSSARVSLVFATLPVVTLAIGWARSDSGVTPRILAAIICSVIGVAVLLAGDALSGRLAASDLIGLGCAALATLTAALCSNLYGPYLRRYGVVKVSVIAMAASLAPLGLMGMIEAHGTAITDWSAATFFLIGFIGLSSGIGYLMWLYALANAPAGIVTAFLALSPITAVAFSVIWLDMRVNGALAVALVLIIGGLAFTGIRPQPKPENRILPE